MKLASPRWSWWTNNTLTVSRDEFLAEIKDRLQHAQDLMKDNYDQHHRELEFVGDWVWLRLHHCLAATLTYTVLGASPHWPCCLQVGTATQVPHP
jgi:hypothetical protein